MGMVAKTSKAPDEIKLSKVSDNALGSTELAQKTATHGSVKNTNHVVCNPPQETLQVQPGRGSRHSPTQGAHMTTVDAKVTAGQYPSDGATCAEEDSCCESVPGYNE